MSKALMELAAESGVAHYGLLASKLGKKASRNLGAIHSPTNIPATNASIEAISRGVHNQTDFRDARRPKAMNMCPMEIMRQRKAFKSPEDLRGVRLEQCCL